MKREKLTKSIESSPSGWGHNTTPLLKIDFQAIKRKVVWVNFSKWLWPLLKEQKEVCWINGEGMWGRGVRFVEILDSIFHISEIGLEFPHTIRVVIALSMDEVFKFFIF